MKTITLLLIYLIKVRNQL